MAFAVQLLAFLGFLLSFYALNVKWRHLRSKTYKPLCDFRENISCTKAFASKYGKIGGLPNPVYGIVFYALVFWLASRGLNVYVLYLAILAVLGSIFLAYISYIKQRNFCLVCTGIYLINVLLLVFSLL